MSDLYLTPQQKYDLISQYCEIVVDGMDYKSLEQYAHESMTDYFDNLILSEIKDEIDNYDEELFDELVDNVTQQYPKQDVNNQTTTYSLNVGESISFPVHKK